MAHISIRVDAVVKERLKMLANELDTSVSKILRTAAESILIKYTDELFCRDDEDIHETFDESVDDVIRQLGKLEETGGESER